MNAPKTTRFEIPNSFINGTVISQQASPVKASKSRTFAADVCLGDYGIYRKGNVSV